MIYTQVNCEALVQETKSDNYFSQTFRTSLRQSQSLLGLLHCFLVLEFLPLRSTSFGFSSMLNSTIVGFNMFLLLLGLGSFLFSGLFMEYNEKQRAFHFLRCDMPLVSTWFPVGVPETVSVFLAAFWLITSIVISVTIPELQGYAAQSTSNSLVSLYLPSLWSCCHQLNAISWTASAFLTVVDLLNFLS